MLLSNGRLVSRYVLFGVVLMRLTMHTDFALRLMMLLALEPDDLHTIEEIARRYGISRNHLMKVTQTLTQAGFIESQRGRKGGIRLAKEARAINLGQVVRATEDSTFPFGGFFCGRQGWGV